MDTAERNGSAAKTTMICAAIIVAACICHAFARLLPPFAESAADLIRVCLYTGLFSAWGVSVRRRVVQPSARRYLVAVAAVMVLWLILREFKWRFVTDPDALRYLWYLYYVPILLIPFIALFVSMSLGKSEKYEPPAAASLLYIPTLALIALVLTNDLHQLVFAFPEGAAVWSENDHSYAVGYMMIIAWVLLCALAAFFIMLSRARIPRSGRIVWLPLVPVGIGILYVVSDTLGSPVTEFLARHNVLNDLAVFVCLVFTGFFEACIRGGLIQTNSRYSDLFSASKGISARITDSEYTTRYAASDAVGLPREIMERAGIAPVIAESGLRVHSIPVNGGHAVWTEDISELLSLREDLEDRREELRERNALLKYEYEREKAHKTIEEQNRLYDLLQSRTQKQIDEIDSLVGEYGRTPDDAGKRRVLCRIALLGSYIKRRRDLLLSSGAAASMPSAKLSNALDESFRALKKAGIRGAYSVQTDRDLISAEAVSRAYDFFEDAAEAAYGSLSWINVRVAEVNGALRENILIECGGDADFSALAAAYPGSRVIRDEEDGSFELLLPLEGGDAS